MKSLCVVTIKLNTLTDVPYQMKVYRALFTYVKPVKEVASKILNNGRVYITRSVITRFFPMDPDDRVIMELQSLGFAFKCVTLKVRKQCGCVFKY